jgi:tellurite resistance protein
MFMLRLLAAVSWSDGELSADEAAKLERLIQAADLDDAERSEAREWMTTGVELGTIDIAALSTNQRLATYQAAVRIALTDQQVDDAERSFLDRVREALGIDAEQAAEIEADMPRHD